MTEPEEMLQFVNEDSFHSLELIVESASEYFNGLRAFLARQK